MATQFTGKVLSLLGRIYQFLGGPGPTDHFELDLPIQAVHDVSREAELGACLGKELGYFIDAVEITHAAADTQLAVHSPFATLPIISGAASIEYDVWVLDTWLQRATGVGHVTAAGIGLIYPIGFPGLDPTLGWEPIKALFSFSAAKNFCNRAGAAPIEVYLGIEMRNLFPLKMPRVGTIGIRTISDDAMTVGVFFLCWVGPRGSTPPGMR